MLITAVIEGANKAQMASSIEMVIVKSTLGIKSFLSSFDETIIPVVE